jgi:phage shock protein PspC (stress-responsive transcriptional regulator)
MNTNTVDPEAPTTEPTDSRPEPRYGYDPGRTALRRPFEDRMLAGVAAGLARYFGVDTTIVRIAFVVLTIVGGGAGVPLYLAAWLLIPEDGADKSIAASFLDSRRYR